MAGIGVGYVTYYDVLGKEIATMGKPDGGSGLRCLYLLLCG